jgi:hypothetical protein
MLLVLPAAAAAWGPIGHTAVCEIAWQESSPRVRSEIRSLLAGERYWTWPAACNWADYVAHDEKYAWSAPHHYINVDPKSDAIDLARDCPVTGPGCVLRAIAINRQILAAADEPRARRGEALKFIGHFVADLHQPLHVSYARDRGGNTISVMYFGEPSNLHRVWDSGLISRRDDVDPKSLARAIRLRITDEERASWSHGTPLDWAHESYDLAREVAYREPARGWIIDDAYFEAHVEIVHERLAMAGIRLAALLSQTFDAP